MLGSIEAFLLHLGNGLTFEFGDDLHCYLRQEAFGWSMAACRAETVRHVARLGEAHAYAAFAGTLIGYAITPLSAVLAAIAGRPKSAGEAFGRGFGLELVEGALSVLGQLITDQIFATAIWSLGLSAVIAPVRGGVAAVTFTWVRSALFRFVILLAVLGGIAIGLDRFGLLPA
ncbi:MAG: hypothetical protein AAFX62_17010 [Pseudomonadota bacterium]